MMESNKINIIDVRNPIEYKAEHIEGSINIPLKKIPLQIDELKKMKNIILCCASGKRSAQAALFLKRHNINCRDAGAWTEVNKLLKLK